MTSIFCIKVILEPKAVNLIESSRVISVYSFCLVSKKFKLEQMRGTITARKHDIRILNAKYYLLWNS
ncbi:MAG: hypothetical protein ACPLSP_01830, partial [Fervidicoccus fontis]